MEAGWFRFNISPDYAMLAPRWGVNPGIANDDGAQKPGETNPMISANESIQTQGGYGPPGGGGFPPGGGGYGGPP
ncbi:MAG: phosphopeptide-binding protein, partial [Polyangiaceae bacterium]